MQFRRPSNESRRSACPLPNGKEWRKAKLEPTRYAWTASSAALSNHLGRGGEPAHTAYDRLKNCVEVKLSDDRLPKAAPDVEHEKLGREELLALLRDVTEQRDQVLSQYEAMALQVDESTREIDDAQLEAQHNAKKAEDSEHLAEQEAARANELSRQLDEERRKRAEIAARFARFRDAMTHAPVEDPWGVLWRAISQIVSDWVAWARAKIPPESPLLPWFDRAVAFAKTAGRLAVKWGRAFFEWAKPRVIDLWKWLESLWKRLESEVARRVSKK